MDVFTSITLNYLPKARMMANSLKKFHRDWRIHLLICDFPGKNLPNDFSLYKENEPFDEIHWVTELEIPNIEGWIFKHGVVEICTASKGPFTKKLLSEGANKVLYFDPDIAIFNSLSQLNELLDQYSILLTPHLLMAEDNHRAILDNEISGALKHGSFNFGFYGVKGDDEGKTFGKWWSHRLQNYCYDDIPNGLFTDQKWGDLIPSYFENYHIIRDPGCNVASWNLSKRKVYFSDNGTLLVNSSPLKFFHFTGYDSGSGKTMTSIYSGGNPTIDEIWTWYRLGLDKFGQNNLGNVKWFYDNFENGDKIPIPARLLYRSREDLQSAFPNPYSVDEGGGYWNWYKNQYV